MKDKLKEEYMWIDYVLDICRGINFFTVDGVQVFIACTDMQYPADSHVHNDFEFMCVKRQTLTNVLCEDQVLVLPQNHIMPFIPMQRHGCASPVIIKQYIAFAFPPEFCQKFHDEIPLFDFVFKNLPFPASPRFDYLVGYLFESYSAKKSQNILKRIVELIFVELCEPYIKHTAQFAASAARKVTNSGGLQKAKAFLDEHLNLPFCLDEVAKVANISKYYFCRMFKAYYGVTARDYLEIKKIEYAKSEMATSDKSLTAIAAELRFDSLGHFSRQFKRQCGVSPGAYKSSIVK